MRDLAARNVIAEWLEERELPELVPRQMPPVDLSRPAEILAVIGPRRAGKTFYMFQLIGQLIAHGVDRTEILFVDLEDYRLVDFEPGDVEQLLVAFQQLTGRAPRYLFLDEVQRLPNWSRVVRTLHNSGRYRIVISGSSAELMSREVATELRGRSRDLVLLPFTFSELLQARQVRFTRATLQTSARGRLMKVFDEYLHHGGYPEVTARQSALEKRQLLQTYYQTTFYKDILERHAIRAHHLMELLMRYCLDTYSDLLSISALEKRLKAHGLAGSKRTISNFLQYLQQAFFILLSEKFSYSPTRRLMNPKKVYLLDLGFRHLSAEHSPNLGKALENAVAIELFRRREDFYYFQNSHQVDFITASGGKPRAAIQVCWELDARNEKRELSGLVEAARELKLKECRVITYSQESTLRTQGLRVSVVPAWKWLLKQV